MVEAGMAQAVAEVSIGGLADGARRAVTQYFDVEVIIVGGRQLRELLVGVGPFVHHAKSSFSTKKRFSASKSGTRSATWWPRIEAKEAAGGESGRMLKGHVGDSWDELIVRLTMNAWVTMRRASTSSPWLRWPPSNA